MENQRETVEGTVRYVRPRPEYQPPDESPNTFADKLFNLYINNNHNGSKFLYEKDIDEIALLLFKDTFNRIKFKRMFIGTSIDSYIFREKMNKIKNDPDFTEDENYKILYNHHYNTNTNGGKMQSSRKYRRLLTKKQKVVCPSQRVSDIRFGKLNR
jgi:hypothetical protein